MKLRSFSLERYFARHEFSVKHLMSSSDCDGFSVAEILELATPEERMLWDKLKLGYTESLGLPALREAIAAQYQTIKPENINVMSPGEVNFILMNVLLEKGDHVICISPAYQSLYEVAIGLGCEVSFWKPCREDDWRYATEDLEKLFRKNTKLLIINFPHNPTGYLPERQDLKNIIDLAARHNAYVFSDEMYAGLVRKPEYALPLVCDMYDKGISLWGMAKSFALAGARIGWVATRNETLLEQISSFKDYLTICNNAPGEILALIALRNAAKLIGRNNKIIADNAKVFKEFCDRTGLFTFHPPKAGSTAFVKLNNDETAMNFSERLVNRAGIMTLPSEMFDFGEKHIRIGLGRRDLPETLSVLEKNSN